MRKKTILYCEDQERFRQQFLQRHKDHYDIILVEDTRELLNTLEKYKTLPDIVLLDLYHPREEDSAYREKVEQAEKALAELDKKIEETNNAVIAAWEPAGLDVLKLIRQKYSAHKLPVAIYTQKGLILLGDNELREAELNGADWIIKKKLSARTEEVAIDRIIMRTPSRISASAEKSYRWILALSWLIIGLLASRLLFNSSQFLDITIAVIVACITGLFSYLIAPFIPKMADKN